jgi:hypothetical protein
VAIGGGNVSMIASLKKFSQSHMYTRVAAHREPRHDGR